MTAPLTWNDQPEQLADEGTIIVFSAHFNGRAVEVRQPLDAGYYVTTGNLFGSQTIKCPTPMHVFAVLDLAANAKQDANNNVPAGCTLLEGPDPKPVRT